MKAAQKFAAKGQLDKAIAEWEKLVKDRKDGNVHNAIGDLQLKKGAEQDAAESFTKAAELFRKDGFYPKAIAVYKKVLNLLPNDTDALIALAKLNADRGLMGNAIDHYYRAAEIFNTSGATENATKIVEKMLQLSPADISTRSKIAYLYFRIGLRERAANEYASIAAIYLDKNDDEKALEFHNKALEYDPANARALLGMSRLAEKSNDIEHAFELLEKALSNDENNREILLYYSQLAMNVHKIEEAKKAAQKLIEADPSDTRAQKLMGNIYIEEGQLDKAWEELAPYFDDEIKEENASEARKLLEYFKDLHPVAAKERLLNISRTLGDDSAIVDELKELASLHEKEGSDEKALSLYHEALQLRPDDSISADRIKELELKAGIVPLSPGPISEESATIEDDMANLPSLNEISFPGVEDTDDEASDEEDMFTLPEEPAALDIEIIKSNGDGDEPHSENTTGFDLDVISSQANNEVPAVSPEPQSLSEEDFAAKKAEADFYVQQGLEDEAVSIYLNLAKMFPDNEELISKLNALGVEAPRIDDIRVEIEKTSPSSSSSLDNDLQSLFEQFGNPEEEIDYESRYMAGLELKQKGFLDDAIKELQLAARDQENKQRNGTMLALCYMDKELFPRAIEEFNIVLNAMPPSASTYLHVKYELANAHLSNKDYSMALELFLEVQAQEPDFKDVSEKVESAKVKSNQPQQKKDRVSYI